jgi:hypothetical protein
MFYNLTHYYCRWTRGMPYLIGVGLSYLYVEHGGTKNPTPVLVSRRKIAVLWCATIIVLTLCLQVTYGRLTTDGKHQGDCVWSSAQSLAWTTFSNLAYSLRVALALSSGLGCLDTAARSRVFCEHLVHGRKQAGVRGVLGADHLDCTVARHKSQTRLVCRHI